MSALAVTLVVLGLGLACLYLISKWPVTGRTLDKARIGRFLRGLMEFGLEGTYLALKEARSGDVIRVTKRGLKGAPPKLEVYVSGRNVRDKLGESFRAEMGILDQVLRWGSDVEHSKENAVWFALSGLPTSDPAALEGVIRLIARYLQHASNARYKIEFEGPADYGVVASYYGMKKS